MCHSDLVISAEYGNTQTHEDEGRVQVLIVLPGIISVEFFRFSAIYCEEVVSRIVGFEGFKELFEGGMEAGEYGCQCVSDYLTAAVDWIRRTTLDRSERPWLVPAAGTAGSIPSPRAKVGLSPSVVIVAGVKRCALDQPQSERQPSNITHTHDPRSPAEYGGGLSWCVLWMRKFKIRTLVNASSILTFVFIVQSNFLCISSSRYTYTPLGIFNQFGHPSSTSMSFLRYILPIPSTFEQRPSHL